MLTAGQSESCIGQNWVGILDSSSLARKMQFEEVVVDEGIRTYEGGVLL